MVRGCVALVLVALTPIVALAGPMEEFAAAREKYKIVGISTPLEIRELKADAYVELQGRVFGSIKGEGGSVTILVKFGDVTQTVESKTVPDWLIMGATEVRMIVKAIKVDTQLIPAMELVASVPEADVVILEAKMLAENERKAEAARKKAELARLQMDLDSQSQSQLQSRSGFRDFSSTPPAGSTFSGIIGGANNASVQQLMSLVPEYSALILAQNKTISGAQAQLIAECVLAYSSSFGVDARLVIALIQHESNFNPRSTSHAGAQGLGQLMPDTWKSLGISDPYDIVQNVYGTVRTIRGHLERQGKESKDTYEQLVRALAAYNAGPGAVKKYGGLPPYAETEAYVERVMRTYFKLSGKNK